jgi:hypothetical protein
MQLDGAIIRRRVEHSRTELPKIQRQAMFSAVGVKAAERKVQFLGDAHPNGGEMPQLHELPNNIAARNLEYAKESCVHEVAPDEAQAKARDIVNLIAALHRQCCQELAC